MQTPASLTTGLVQESSHQSLMPGRRKINGFLLLILWIAIGAYPLVEGFSYYFGPFTERPYAPLHDAYKPSGFVGQGLGILGTLMMLVGVVSYMVRKRWTFLHRFGKLRSWLTFHIFLCTLGPFLVLLHTTFKFGNIASISFWSMAVVVASGVFGRYVYVRIPKTINGQFLSKQVIQQAQTNLVKRLVGMTALDTNYITSLAQPMKPTGRILPAVWRSLHFELRKPAIRRKIQGSLQDRGVSRAVLQQAVPLLMDNAHLQLRAQVMQPFVRAFGYWHVFHIPLALVMLIALLVHVGVAIAFGYTWVF